jgi:hypothetical protein
MNEDCIDSNANRTGAFSSNARTHVSESDEVHALLADALHRCRQVEHRIDELEQNIGPLRSAAPHGRHPNTHAPAHSTDVCPPSYDWSAARDSRC